MSAPTRTVEFTDRGDFAAYDKAVDWCRAAGYSVGMMQRGEPIGLMFGDVCISKWRNMTPAEREELHGRITGDFRKGPVRVETYHPAPLPAAPNAALLAAARKP